MPALLYIALNQGGDATQGWAIPMATDTAFAIGILALLGARVPAGLTTFLLALAIIDDMGAVLVIALFYSETISILAEPQKHTVVERLQETAAQATTPLQLWERALEHPVALFVLPLFALVNAGIVVEPAALPGLLSDTLALGIVVGLVVGKVAGITLATFVVLALGLGRLPDGMLRRHLPGLGLLGGMGFTMSIFIAGLGFHNQPEQLLIAKTGILTASLIAGVGGYLWLRFAAPDHSRNH